MTTTASITHCWKKGPDAPRRAWAFLRWLPLLVCLAWWAGPARAVEGGALKLERGDDGLYLSTVLQFNLPDLARDALEKGIPLYFVAEVEMVRDRWYWSDKQVAQTFRYLRLSYQPLTRRWRLSLSPQPLNTGGLGVALGQNFDELEDALAAMKRITRWRIADLTALDVDQGHTVQLRFRLDLSQLPRPFQIGAVGQSGWNLLVVRSQRWPLPEGAR
ncbi:DUF4390 domain-containing protein [Acidovorax lacteus]|uniref:DUF4390 domain-containing protein n=1 Tax=Acidovorax lacteus TaxID=1924988 RepID=A0ABP8LAC9_9BURK